MTPEQFIYWLQGYLELSGSKSLSDKQVQIIRDHLSTCFLNKTPIYPNTLPYNPLPLKWPTVTC